MSFASCAAPDIGWDALPYLTLSFFFLSEISTHPIMCARNKTLRPENEKKKIHTANLDISSHLFTFFFFLLFWREKQSVGKV